MREGDLARVATLSGTLGYPVDVAEVRARFARLVAAAEGALFVAELAPQGVVGFIHVHGRILLESAPHAEIAALVVDDVARRTGVGRAPVGAAEAWARDHGFDRARVRSNVAREESHRFYPALGYVVAKTQHVYERRLAVST